MLKEKITSISMTLLLGFMSFIIPYNYILINRFIVTVQASAVDLECEFFCVVNDFAYVIEDTIFGDNLRLYDYTQANSTQRLPSTVNCLGYNSKLSY